tara:strand:- start:87 stop:335 length:249 start_codon:yes stop_codon:yes gene_type:complete
VLDVFDELGDLADFFSEYEHYDKADRCCLLAGKISEVFGLPSGKKKWKEFFHNLRYKAVQIKAEEKLRYKEFKPLLKISREI